MIRLPGGVATTLSWSVGVVSTLEAKGLMRGSWLWLGWAVVVSACQPTLDGPIDYRRTSGWGATGPGIHIELTGTATTSHTCRTPGVMHLDDVVLSTLRQKISNANLPTLRPNYRFCKDCDYETVSAQLGGKIYRIYVDVAHPDVPARLHAVISELRVLAGDGPDEDGKCSSATAKR
jgi:hypothetical protein